MIFRLIFLLVVSQIICVSSFNYENYTRSVIVQPRLQGIVSTTKATYPWAVILIQVSTNKQLGVGAVISKRYAMFTASVVSPVKSTPADATVYSSMDQRAYLVNGVSHPALEILVHPQLSGNQYNIALIKVCPTFTGITPVVLAPQHSPYPSTTLARVVKYFGVTPVAGLVYTEKNVGANDACKYTFNWDPSIMFCLANDAAKFGEIQDYNLPVVIDSKLAGFLMTVQSGTYGEQVSDITKYLSWISSVEIL